MTQPAAIPSVPAQRERRLYWAWRGLWGGAEAGSSAGSLIAGLGVGVFLLLSLLVREPLGIEMVLLLLGLTVCGLTALLFLGGINGSLAGALGGAVSGFTGNHRWGQLVGLAGGGGVAALLVWLTSDVLEFASPVWCCVVLPMLLGAISGGWWGGRRGLSVVRGETLALVRRALPFALPRSALPGRVALPPRTAVTERERSSPPTQEPDAIRAPLTENPAGDEIRS